MRSQLTMGVSWANISVERFAMNPLGDTESVDASGVELLTPM